MPAEMSRCKHCGVKIMKVNYPDRSLWMHIVNSVLLIEHGACLVAEPMSDYRQEPK